MIIFWQSDKKDFCKFASQVGVRAEKCVWVCSALRMQRGANQITTFIDIYVPCRAHFIVLCDEKPLEFSFIGSNSLN